MATAYATTQDALGRMHPTQDAAPAFTPETASAVSWGAIAAGAAAAAALSLILLLLGVGLGLSSVSPWAGAGVSTAGFGVSTIVWLTLTQLLASAVGGYLAGRLRTRSIAAATDEVYFRDTAHGFFVDSLFRKDAAITASGSTRIGELFAALWWPHNFDAPKFHETLKTAQLAPGRVTRTLISRQPLNQYVPAAS